MFKSALMVFAIRAGFLYLGKNLIAKSWGGKYNARDINRLGICGWKRFPAGIARMKGEP